ncbi:MAG: hypothetical protein V5A59_03465 [Bacteroidales bacterium]|nr:hypothetical protein [Bacteroidales bacterium]MBS3775847.1 hypothetical protein [Bacteroidales bacterium]
MKKYTTFLFIVSLVLMILGFLTSKITTESFQYISLTGFLFAILKILLITITISLAAAMTLPALVIDLIMMLIAGYGLLVTSSLWNIVWNEYTMDWFWQSTEGSSLFFSTLVLIIITVFVYRKG